MTPWTVVHGILQARILEWVAFPFSRGSSQLREPTQVSRIAGGFYTIELLGKQKNYTKKNLNDPHNHNSVITNVEPDILECEVKWALGSITMNKARGDESPAGPQGKLYDTFKPNAKLPSSNLQFNGLHFISNFVLFI